MKSELKEISPTQRELHVQIGAEALKDAYGAVSQKYARAASVPGFRKGYAPLDVVRLRFKDEIRSEVLQKVLPVAVSEAIQEHELQPLAEPHLHIDDVENVKVNGSQPINLHVHVEVMPEIPEPKYQGVEVTRRVKPVEEGEVEDLIANRLQRESALIPVDDRPADTGDTVIVDLEGTFDDDPNGEPISANDLEVKLGDEVIERSFTENLIGVREDEDKEFTVSYPADFSSTALAGKTVHYKAKVKSVGRMETPEMNDEWAKSLDEGYESLADLRNKLRTDLETYARSEADARLRNNAVAKLIEDNPFEVPNTLIDSQAKNLLNNFARDLEQRGVDLKKVEDEFVQMAYSQMRQQAERDVRGAMLLEKIGKMEKIDVSEAEFETELNNLADYYRTTTDEVRKSFEKDNGLAQVRNNLKTRKAIEALIGNAKVTEGDWVDENVGEPKVDEDEKKPKKATKAKANAESKAKAESKTEKPKAAKQKTAK
ncbi:MAG TPA: trigger factor [Pyrinomonadaceae bacterium]|jgi:trigger factor